LGVSVPRRVFAVLMSLLLAPAAVSPSRAATFDWAQGWREVAHFDGSVPVTATTYLSGLGTFASVNHARPLGFFDYADSAVTVAVTMGSYTDYFRPGAGVHRLRDMMIANIKHLWSNSAGGTFAAPPYFTSGLGGSALGFPADGRFYLTFWGGGPAGGCCQQSPADPGGWGRPFRVYVQVPMESLSVAVVGSGTVERSTARTLFPSDTAQAVTLTAVPASGWAFVGWSGDTTGDANPVTLTMSTDRSVTATFESRLDAGDAAPPARSGITLVTPNPASGAVTVEYAVASAAPVRVSVLDVQGRRVAILADEWLAPGRYRATWTGGGAGGRAAGTYFVRLEAGAERASRRVTITD
jgi:hypothetical protein